jgi:hypothetical protein
VLFPGKWRFGFEQKEVYIATPNSSGYIIVYHPKNDREYEKKASHLILEDKKIKKP